MRKEEIIKSIEEKGISGKEEVKQSYDRQYPPYPVQFLLLVGGRGLHTEKPG